MNANKILGQEGEVSATNFLKSKGYTIRHTNWYFKHKELDIVAEIPPKGRSKLSTLVIIEVKTRNYKYSISEMPYTAVNRQKERFLIEATNAYIEKYNLDMEVRYDIISVIHHDGKTTIHHIEDAFYPEVNV